MKTILCPSRERGTVLVTTLVIALLVGVAVGGLLVVSQQQNYLTVRSKTWCSALPMAEAGVEEAMAHLNTRPENFESNGWTRDGTNFTKSRTFMEGSLINGYYFTQLSTSDPPTIVSIGFGRLPLQTNFTRRTVMAIAKAIAPGWGLVGKEYVELNGTPYVDSYDSSNPLYSTDGLYDPLKRRDEAGVGTLSSDEGAIDTGSGEIFGYAATGPWGTVDGNVGDGEWLASNSGIQLGHATDDFNMAIPDVSLPDDWSSSPLSIPLPGWEGGVYYGSVLGAGDWKLPGMSISSAAGSFYIKGNVRLYFTGNLKMSADASFTLAPGATLEVYLGGDMDMQGDAVVNPTGIPANCSIYGLPTCKKIFYAGPAKAYCKLYAPQADIVVSGDYSFSGSVIGNSVTLSGTAEFHYDEALKGKNNPDYRIVSWEEL